LKEPDIVEEVKEEVYEYVPDQFIKDLSEQSQSQSTKQNTSSEQITDEPKTPAEREIYNLKKETEEI
jgi:maltodextrin utilization protein YvdJ